jgi:hypothetical protein
VEYLPMKMKRSFVAAIELLSETVFLRVLLQVGTKLKRVGFVFMG